MNALTVPLPANPLLEIVRPLERWLSFWRRVTYLGECWIWTGGIRDGYGVFKPSAGLSLLAHRVAYELFNGPIPEGLLVRHVVCDNPRCVNPHHLAIGTQQDNQADKVRKGRQAKGASNGRAKLRPEHVQAIRKRTDEDPARVAAEFDVSRRTVTKIWAGENWAHLPPEAP